MTSGEPIADAIVETKLRAPAGFAVALHMEHMRPNLTVCTYPQAWVEHYSLEGLAIADPVVRWACFDTGTTRWSDLAENDEMNVFAQAQSHGMRYGIAVSIGPENDRTMGGFSRADREFTENETAEIAALLAKLHEQSAGLDAFSPAAARMIENIGATLQVQTRFI